MPINIVLLYLLGAVAVAVGLWLISPASVLVAAGVVVLRAASLLEPGGDQ